MDQYVYRLREIGAIVLWQIRGSVILAPKERSFGSLTATCGF